MQYPLNLYHSVYFKSLGELSDKLSVADFALIIPGAQLHLQHSTRHCERQNIHQEHSGLCLLTWLLSHLSLDADTARGPGARSL